jgi:hypothetical protein
MASKETEPGRDFLIKMIYEKISTELKYKIAYTDKQALNFRC